MRLDWLVVFLGATAVSAEEPDAIDHFLSKQMFLCHEFAQGDVSVPFWIHQTHFGGCRVDEFKVSTDGRDYAIDVTCDDNGEILLAEKWTIERTKQQKYLIHDAAGEIFGTLDCGEETK